MAEKDDNDSEGVKPLKGFGGAGVLEVVEEERSGAYRAVDIVKFTGIVYVLHAFQKKSKTVIKTPVEKIDKIRNRLKAAEKHYAQWVDERARARQRSGGLRRRWKRAAGTSSPIWDFLNPI